MILDKGEPVQIVDDLEAPPPAYEEHAEFSSNASSSRTVPQHGTSHPEEKRGEVVYAYTPGRDDLDPQAPYSPSALQSPPGYVYAQVSDASPTSPPSGTSAPSRQADASDHHGVGFRRSHFANNPSPLSVRGRGEGFERDHGRGHGRSHSHGCSSSSPPLPPSSPSDLLNPPPPSFSRPPQSGFPYGPFPLLAHFSQGTGIDGGFASMPPPTHVDPHPFATHDVNEEDWGRFLDDIRRAGSLSPLNKFAVGAVPFAVGIGIIGGGIIVAKGIYDHMKTKKHACAAEIVDHWNNNFFHHRQMEVSLCRGSVKYSGIDRTPPDMPDAKGKADLLDDPESGSDDESSAGEAATRNQGKGCKKDERRERREMKREKRQQRKQCRREEREVKSKPWRLVITYRPLPTA